MNRKHIQILLSILHICVFCIGTLILCHNRDTAHASVSDNTLAAAETEVESETQTELELETEMVMETKTESELETKMVMETKTTLETETDTESMSEIETGISETIVSDTMVSYTFQYTRGKRNLNIRNAPSINGEIIGRIPPDNGGSILELTNDEWAFIEYRGITGYSNLEWLDLTLVDK